MNMNDRYQPLFSQATVGAAMYLVSHFKQLEIEYDTLSNAMDEFKERLDELNDTYEEMRDCLHAFQPIFEELYDFDTDAQKSDLI